MPRTILWATITICAMANTPAHAGWKVTQQEIGPNGTHTVTMLMTSNALRLAPSDAPMGTIIDVKADKLTLVDTTGKRYAIMKLSAFLEQMKGWLAAAKQMIAQLPPEMRKSVPDPSAMLEIKLAPTGKRATVAGYKAQQFTITNGSGQPMGDVWLSKDGLMAEIHKDLVHISKALDVGINQSMGLILSTAQKHGFPVKTNMNFGGQSRTTLLVSIEKTSLPASTFAPPSGFKQVDPQQMMGIPGMPGMGQQQPGLPQRLPGGR